MVLPDMSFELKPYAAILGDRILFGLIALTFEEIVHKIIDNIETGVGIGKSGVIY